jgi:chromosome segregation protein
VIKEVILENFMSYEYARVPLSGAVNIICGPNGSGKSSILLAISLALGQAYTERSRKLGDLIRRGEDVARVSLLLDNRPRKGRRPIRFSKADELLVSRYLRRDGNHWFEVDYKRVEKYVVERVLRELGLNPDNMLIIMHQNMVEEFSVISAEEKLRLLEEAVGFREHRERVLEARERLSALISEESQLLQTLRSAENTLSYWRDVYRKYRERKELEERLENLEVELRWARVARLEKIKKSLGENLREKRRKLAYMHTRAEEIKVKIAELEKKLSSLREEEKKAYYILLGLEKQKSELDGMEKAGKPPRDVANRRKDLEDRVSKTQAEIARAEKLGSKTLEKYIDARVREAVLKYRIRELEGQIRALERETREAEGRLDRAIEYALEAGERIETGRRIKEVEEEISTTRVKIQALGEIPREVEQIYTDYSSLYSELKEKLKRVMESRAQALEEVREREKLWRRVMRDLLREVNEGYRAILSGLDATGEVRLVVGEDIEKAGLELLVGFRGSRPVLLDAYTQSGGERSVAIVSFLLALQQRILSPFRAIDEFDIHMDSSNREAIFKTILSVAKKTGVQYVLITPRQLTVPEEKVNLIVVQNVYGRSEVRRLG